MLEEVMPDLFKIQVPLPENPLRALNAYLVKAPGRSLLVDNGFNTPQSRLALENSLRQLDLDLSTTDFFLTHLHSDHIGLTSALLSSPDSRVFCSQKDGERINQGIADAGYWQNELSALASHGMADEELQCLARTHPGRIYAPPEPLTITGVCDGDQLRYGRYIFTVVDVPGHTPGHVSLYEEPSRTYIAGDHILSGISPNITRWSGVPDSLGDYLHSLDKIERLEILRTLPGHRAIISDTPARIKEIKAHHAARLEEVRVVLERHGPLRAHDVAAHMRWSLGGRSFAESGAQQKCFATGEALAHLDHLTTRGQALSDKHAEGEFFRLI